MIRSVFARFSFAVLVLFSLPCFADYTITGLSVSPSSLIGGSTQTMRQILLNMQDNLNAAMYQVPRALMMIEPVAHLAESQQGLAATDLARRTTGQAMMPQRGY